MTGMGPGTLCKCNGSATPETGGTNDRLLSVYVLRTDTSVTGKTAEEIEQDGVEAGIEPDHKWNADNMLMGVDCEADPPENNNKVWAAARWHRYFPPGEYTQVNDVSFEGQCVTSCPGEAPPPSGPGPGPGPFLGPMSLPMADTKECCGGGRSRSTRAIVRAADVSPVCCEDGWYKYAGVPTSNRIYGARLTVSGQPLRAERIAVAIPSVGYRFDIGGHGSGIILDPLGNDPALNGTASSGGITGWTFVGSPAWCVAAWQGDRRTRTVIASRCREAPTEVALGLNRDIYLQVNSPSVAVCRGSYDVWVKVLDYATDQY